HRLRRARGLFPVYARQLELRINLELHASQPHLHRPALVQLDAEHASLRAVRIIDVDADVAVDGGADPGADGEDLVRVPLAGLDVLLAGFLGQQPAAAFLVEFSPPPDADLRLVPFRFAVRL